MLAEVLMALMLVMVWVVRLPEEFAFGHLVQPSMRFVHVQGESEEKEQIHERRGRKGVWRIRVLEVVIQGRGDACVGIHGVRDPR